MATPLASSLELPGGAHLANRLVKAAMSEGVADAGGDATPRLNRLYEIWSRGGAGLLLSGNVQVDRHHLERPGNVVLDGATDLEALRALAKAGTAGGNHFWAQLSHTGRQVARAINPQPLAPSAVEIDVPARAGFDFAPPRAISEDEIRIAIGQFAWAAGAAKAVGFTGVQFHAAHGYLISQFLSPLANRRTDRWGGSLENRARLLLETIAAVRETVGPGFPIGIKLNSSDFQKGGFTNAECLTLVGWLNDTSLDLLEISGGSLEQPKVVGVSIRDEGEDARPESTRKREAYFLDFAGAIRAAARMPVMVTGGFRSAGIMTAALEAGELDLVGIGRPMIVDPNIARRLLTGEIDRAPTPEASINLFHLLGWFNIQIERLADGVEADLTLDGADAAARFAVLETGYTQRLLEHRTLKAA